MPKPGSAASRLLVSTDACRRPLPGGRDPARPARPPPPPAPSRLFFRRPCRYRRLIGAMTSAAVIGLSPHYATVILTAVGNWLVLMWMALKVGSARKEHGIKYPLLYENVVTSKFDLYVVGGVLGSDWLLSVFASPSCRLVCSCCGRVAGRFVDHFTDTQPHVPRALVFLSGLVSRYPFCSPQQCAKSTPKLARVEYLLPVRLGVARPLRLCTWCKGHWG